MAWEEQCRHTSSATRLLPATVAIVGVIVLRQVPTLADIGVIHVLMGIAIHKPAATSSHA
jgi:hypothetical protein